MSPSEEIEGLLNVSDGKLEFPDDSDGEYKSDNEISHDFGFEGSDTSCQDDIVQPPEPIRHQRGRFRNETTRYAKIVLGI